MRYEWLRLFICSFVLVFILRTNFFCEYLFVTPVFYLILRVEYMHCFNVMDEIPESEPTEIETVQDDLYDTVNLEWHYWGQPEVKKKVTESDVKKPVDLSSYGGFRQDVFMRGKISDVYNKENKDTRSK